jgi:poly(3-hydroxybutyrate) depolymerase
VFHGDRDPTIHPCNGEAVAVQAGSRLALKTCVEDGQLSSGYAYSRTLYADENGQTVIEQWVVYGAGHAWSGGSASGSYTDPRGPDASGEMLRFFLKHPRIRLRPKLSDHRFGLLSSVVRRVSARSEK